MEIADESTLARDEAVGRARCAKNDVEGAAAEGFDEASLTEPEGDAVALSFRSERALRPRREGMPMPILVAELSGDELDSRSSPRGESRVPADFPSNILFLFHSGMAGAAAGGALGAAEPDVELVEDGIATLGAPKT